MHAHEVCVIDTAGKPLDRKGFAHDREGLAELMRWLARFGKRLRIAIERPSGLIVDALVEAGHLVFPIHPNAVKASRPRYRSHGGKSDASDAYLLADLLRTDGHRWQALSPQSDSIRALRCAGALARRPGAHPRGAGQPAHQRARGLLARCGVHLRGHHFAHRSGVPGALSRARQRPRGSTKPLAALLPQPALQRPAQSRRAARALACGRRRFGRPACRRCVGAGRAPRWWRCCSPWSSRSAC